MASVSELAIDNLRQVGLGDVVFTPEQETYQARVASYWSQTSQLKPWAFVQPRNAEEVSKAVKALVAIPECKFAVRSGGHMARGSNIEDGITIDLSLMAKTTYDHETKLANLLPGGTWTDAYHELEKHGRMVAGGREKTVGIGGLLTGGGKTFYTCRVGFGCDQVVNYEVVLADGRIVQANDTENSDLFRVLKGGGNNFGIVTRFDMVTFPAHDVQSIKLASKFESTPEIIEALADFIDKLEAHRDAHVVVIWAHLSGMKDAYVGSNLTILDGEEETQSLKRFLAIPASKTTRKSSVATKMSVDAVSRGKEHVWFTLTFKNDQRIMNKAAELFASRVETLKEKLEQDFYFLMFMQPLPAFFIQHSAKRGGNMFGLDKVEENCVLFVWVLSVATPELRTQFGFPMMKEATDELEAYAKSVDGDVAFRYLNYCNSSQDPMSSYGEENVRTMREAAEKYDPAGVFQTRVPGGFKIPNVDVAQN